MTGGDYLLNPPHTPFTPHSIRSSLLNGIVVSIIIQERPERNCPTAFFY